jgi:phospholipid/cholesterol/gamma-HCH transport system substrate-binding protein
MERDRKLEIKVGIFVSVAIAFLVATIVVLGSEDNLFERSYTLSAKFTDIAGLRNGAAVRLAGMDCGLVSSVAFPKNLEDSSIHITLRVSERCSDRIRGDSLAEIQSQGLLGDKFIALTVGSTASNPLEEGSWLESKDPVELMSYLDGVPEIVKNIQSITHKIDVMLGSEDGRSAGKSIMGILESIRAILEEVEKGDGVIHALVYDKGSGDKLKSVLRSVDLVASNAAEITDAIKTGDGALHALIYEDKVSEMLTNLTDASDKIDTLLADIQTGNGLIHDLVYTDAGQSVLADLKDVSSDMKDIVASVKRGEGTIGGLLADPTLYQDVKTLLGKAQRNKILKAYVRETLRKNEQEEGLSESGLTKP